MACPRRRVQGSLQPLRYRHRRHERAQETTRVVRHVQGHHSLYRRQTPPRGAGAEARPGAYRPRRAQAVTTSDAHRAIDAVWRIESAKLIAGLTRIVRDVALAEDLAQDALVAALDDHVGDDLLGLIFTTCHPVLSTEARVALTLRLLGGLTTDEIARAFLVPEPTIAQR